jgi:DNA-binding NarL/FixJ family response regulator
MPIIQRSGVGCDNPLSLVYGFGCNCESPIPEKEMKLPQAKTLRVLLADDHALFREGMKHILVGLDESVEVIEAGSYDEARQIIKELPAFDMALVDLGMPGLNDFDGLRDLCSEIGDVPVVVVSAMEGGNEIRKAMDCGASGYVPKTLDSNVVLSALKLVFSGGIYLPTNLLSSSGGEGGSDRRGGNGGKGPLTPRQCDVLDLMAKGYSNKEIARNLNLAEGTVKLHVTALLKALDVSNRTQAVIKATAIGLTTTSSTDI